VLKCLQSAIDNAENNHSLDLDGLVVAHAHVGKNIVMKRMHARARGRGVRIEKHFSQITIVLRDTTKQPEAA
jgi:large subunit ribosomal protein L22